MEKIAHMSTKSAARCGFENLAAEINEEHRLARDHAETAIQHALRAGELLLVAKQQLPHGKWLPWLRDNVKFSERSAQAYMRIATRYDVVRKRIEDTDDGISVRRALGYLTQPLHDETGDLEQQETERDDQADTESLKEVLEGRFGGDLWKFSEWLIERPFCRWDVMPMDGTTLLKTKLLSHLDVPPIAAVALNMMEDYPETPVLRAVPWHQMREALEALAPLARGDGMLPPINASADETTYIIGAMRLTAQRLCGKILDDLKGRPESFEDWQHQAQTILDDVMTKIEAVLSNVAKVSHAYEQRSGARP